ncbi:MAG: cation-transporting P-type ATPase [Actinomycetota bacterium]|nr:cation-transporting P-type ATPase [Actinomycetota bacterium]
MVEPDLKIWALPKSEVFDSLGSSTDGLDDGQAGARLEEYGPNAIEAGRKSSLLLKFLANFYHLMALLLWAAAAFAFLGQQPQLGWAVIGVIVINALFSFFQEYKAEKATEALQKLVPLRAKVIRGGKRLDIPASELVPGDLMVLEEGDKISADARVAEEFELRTDNSTLTGESEPVRRTADAYIGEDISAVEAPNLVFAGTAVAFGSGRAVAFATGMATEFGKIAKMTQAVTPELSPLQKEINRVVKIIAMIAAGSGVLLFIVGSQIASLSVSKSFTFAIGMIVANVPEGLLPTVTLALAVGVQRLVKKHALVKKLSSVETLGSTNVICTDKTGTLTQNEMTVREIWFDSQSIRVGGGGYEPVGDFFPENADRALNDDEMTRLRPLLESAVLCNNARALAPDDEHAKWHILGDPTEAALVVAAKKAGIDDDELWRRRARIFELPFDSRRKRMSTINLEDKDKVANVKGAPKEVLALCDSIFSAGSVRPLTEADRAAVIEANDTYARGALRVIAVARRIIPADLAGDISPETVENNLTFLGLMAMMDPPRPEVEAALMDCRTAGIRVIMITGDYGLTAESIARRINLVQGDKLRTIIGAEIDSMTEDDLKKALGEGEVLFARVSPEHKMMVAAALKSMGQIVAMTGDGVNDAPALRKADIGVAMGITGTDVAKEASEMIITDDNFASIVHAVKEGRVVFENMQKFIVYIFAHLTPEMVPFILFVLLQKYGMPMGISVMQILAIDLGTETIPALGLGVEEAEPGIMERKPRSRKDGLVNKAILFRAYVFLGLIESALVMGGMFWVLFRGGWHFGMADISNPASPHYTLFLKATTMTFLGIVTAQVGTVFASRTNKASLFEVGFFSNTWVNIGIVFELALAAVLMYVPFLSRFFGTAPLGPVEWVVALSFAPVILSAEEIRKWLRRRSGRA